MNNISIEVLKDLQNKYKLEMANINTNLSNKDINTLIFRRVAIKSAVLPALEFLIKDLQK